MGSWQRELIRLVRERPSLYDKEDQFFHDTKNTKLRKWQEIAEELNKCGYVQVANETVDVTFVQKKWRNIRDNFVKNINRYNEQCMQTGSENAGRPRFSYWREMRWILPYNKQAASISEEAMSELMKYMDPADDPDTEDFVPEIAEVRAIATTFNSDDILSSSSITAAAKPKPTSDVKPRSSLKRKIRDLIQANEETKMNSASLYLDRGRQEVSEDRLFGQLVEKRLSSIPSGAPKERLKVDILRMLCNTQYPEAEEITFVTDPTATPSPADM